MTEEENPYVSDLSQERSPSDLNGESVNAIDYLHQEGTFQDKRVKNYEMKYVIG